MFHAVLVISGTFGAVAKFQFGIIVFGFTTNDTLVHRLMLRNLTEEILPIAVDSLPVNAVVADFFPKEDKIIND
jgi:hypothetical protein